MFNEEFCHKILQAIYDQKPTKDEFEEFIRVFDNFKDEYLSQCELIDSFNRRKTELLVFTKRMVEG